MEERSQYGPTLATVELDIFQLREDAASSGDDTRNSHETVQVSLSKISKGKTGGQFRDSDVDFRMDPLVVGVVEKDGLKSDFIERGKHGLGRVGQKVGQNRLRSR